MQQIARAPVPSQTSWELLDAQARCAPDAPAICAPGRRPLSYRGLWLQVSEAAGALGRMGPGRGDRVALVLPNGPEMAVAFLAAASCATCAPLNPAYRADEFAFYLSDLQAKAVIVPDGAPSPVIAVARELGITVLGLRPRLDAEAGVFELTGPCVREVAEPIWAEPHGVALVLHTSGTTSRPKIVPLSHANVCASAHSVRAALELTPADRCLNVMPLFHIHGLAAALLASLAAGGSVVCAPGFYAPDLLDWLARERATWYTAVPSMHQAILARAAAAREAIARLSLRFIRSCSSALPPQVMAELEEAFGVPVIEAYGMTEAAHQIASNPLPPRVRKPGCVGVAAGPEVAIMDEGGHLLPAEETGEIVIRGASVTAGYENNPQANPQAFTHGWFRTGDQGRLDAEGYLFITGRLKEIVNRGGEKVSPREVDEVLLQHPAVAQAVTFAMPHRQLGEEVAAAIVLRDRAVATEEAIQEFAARRLADFKVPRRVVFLEEIPKGPTGKLQRIGLAARLNLTSEQTPAQTAPYASPRTPLEEKWAGIWAQVLHLERVGIHDNFFEVGGDSVLATLCLSRMRQGSQVELSLLEFFKAPTLAAQALLVLQKQASQMQDEDVAALLTDLDAISDEDARRLLSQGS